MGEKINFADFQKSKEKEQHLYNGIDSKVYSDDEIENQIKILKMTFEYIQKRKSEGAEIKTVKNEVGDYMHVLLGSIASPSLNCFYKSRTLEYVLKNKSVLENHIKIYLKENKNYKYIKKNDYTESIDKNIEILISEALAEIANINFCKSDKFNEFQQKLKQGKLTLNDTDTVIHYLGKFMQEIECSKKGELVEKIKKSPEILYNKIMSNFNNIFDIQISKIKSSHEGNKTPQQNSILMMQKPDKIKLQDVINASVEKSEITTVKLKKFIDDPFISKNTDNNLLIFIYTMLGGLDEIRLNAIYELLQKSKNNPLAKRSMLQIISKLNFDIDVLDVRSLMSERVYNLVQLYERTGALERFNSKNNERLEEIGLTDVTIKTDELAKVLKNANSNNMVSFESITAMSAFYTNRLAKILHQYTRPLFIMDKIGAFEKIYENEDMKFEDLELQEEALSLYMSEYDMLEDIIYGEYYQSLSHEDRKKVKTDKYVAEKSRKLFGDICSSYSKPYQKKYGNFLKDIDNVSRNSIIIDYFYQLKNFAMKSLIYTALTNNEKSIINWGYVPRDENEDKGKILIGFDIKSLNMPVFLHMKTNELLDLIKGTTGDTKIPVYEGGSDVKVLKGGKRMTTQVLYPLTKELRKKLSKIQRNNCLVNHLKWLQDPKKKPSYVQEPGSRIYNIETGAIEKKLVKKEDQDPR